MSELRKRLQKQRREQDPVQAARLSREVTERFIAGASVEWRGLKVGMYRALGGELDLRGLESELEARGAELYFPRVVDRGGGVMEFARAPGSDPSLWVRGAYGIEEPSAASSVLEPSQLDVIFVPGVAFGPAGERLGAGGGFYDRYLAQAPQALKVALAFDFQWLDALSQESWDQGVDWIWTERRQFTPVRNRTSF